MKRTKKNNKGFSLVELIVVVLIMAIIAVALAPQVMKWVNESRKSADASTYDSVVAAAQDALADETVWNDVAKETAAFTITIDDSSCTIGGPASFVTEVTKQLGGNAASIKFKQKDASAIVTVQTDGTVVRTQEPGGTNTGNTNTGNTNTGN